MNLVFNRYIALCMVCFWLYPGLAQDGKQLDSDIFGEIGVSFLVPNAYGNNFLSEGYDLSNGFNVDGIVHLKPSWTVGAQLSHFTGDVTDISLVGGINKSAITHIHALGGYSILKKSSRIAIRPSLGLGYATYRHRQSSTRFRDDGFSISANVSISYRLSNFIGIYLKLDNHWDFLSIDTAPELKRFFRRPQYFAPSIGIKVYSF
ncbi:hypothetical protein [Flagellimonas sp. 2504JD4-2]